MKKTTLLYFFLLASILFSCKTSFRISVKEPAQVSLPADVTTFGIINNVNNENSPEKIINVALGTQQLNGNILAAERAMDGIMRGLDKSNYMRGEIIPLDSNNLIFGELNWIKLDSIAAVKNLDGYIELRELRTISPVGGTILANATGQSSTRLDGTLYVTIHLTDSDTKYERISVRHSYKIPTSGSINVIDLLKDMARKREYYRALGFELGYKTGKLVYPKWVWANRTFYNSGSKALKRAKPMIKEGNWDIAEKQLLYDVDNGKEKIRGRVLYNLALVKEGQGDIDAAIAFAERSALECGNKLANDYLRILRKRKRIIDSMQN